jgi:DNA-binding CsgD family transcriptional regulator
VVYVERERPSLSLSGKGLSPTEIVYVRAILAGREPRQIAEQFGVSGSTVRSALSRAYKKLGIPGVADLLALRESHQIDE